VREAHHRDDEDVEQLLLVVDVVVAEPALEPEPRVVHQDVDRAVGIGEPFLDAGELVAVGEVGRDDLHGAAGARELGGDLVEPGAVPRYQHQVVPAARELVGELEADPGGGTGDEGGSG
jgi:hypothetical protein